MYLAVFVTADIVSLVLQAIGGGQAAVQAEAGNDTTKSTHISEQAKLHHFPLSHLVLDSLHLLKNADDCAVLAGILFQLATMTVFVILATDFILRVLSKNPHHRRVKKLGHPATPPTDTGTNTPAASSPPLPSSSEKAVATANSPSDLRKAQFLLTGVAFASLMIFVRGIYRSVELAQGWSGFVITHEPFFTWLDGFPMVLCYAAFAVAHPGWLLPRRRGWKSA